MVDAEAKGSSNIGNTPILAALCDNSWSKIVGYVPSDDGLKLTTKDQNNICYCENHNGGHQR